MSHNHSHRHHSHSNSNSNIGITIVLNIAVTVAQIVGGIISGSTALLSDAAHNFSDVFALIISYAAKKLSGREKTETKTFGFKRAEIFAAFINSSVLIGIAVVLLIEGVKHFINPVSVDADLVIILAGLSILLNGLSVLLIKKEAEDSINMKSAYLHLFSDMLTSVAVVAGGLAMKYFNLYRIDAFLTVFIALYLIFMSFGIFKDTVKILMQFVPEGINIANIAEDISKIENVKNAHHIHVWQLNEHEIMFEAHIDTEKDINISDFEKILQEIKHILKKYDINHCNIQPEFAVKDDKQIINSKH